VDDDVAGIIRQALYCGKPCFRMPTEVKSCYRPPCPPELVAVTVTLGEAVQVEPMKPVLKAPGTKHLKL